MNASNASQPMSYAQYRRLPESVEPRELIDGELLMTPAPATIHQVVAQNLEFLLMAHVRATGCGRMLHAPVDVVLDVGGTRHVVQPDIVFIGRARDSIVTPSGIFGAPDLVVEVLSRATAARDRGRKKALYADAGVREYWLVDPASAAIEACTLDAPGRYAPARRAQGPATLAAHAIAGFSVPLAEIFPPSSV